jgi:hypothetical protein
MSAIELELRTEEIMTKQIESKSTRTANVVPKVLERLDWKSRDGKHTATLQVVEHVPKVLFDGPTIARLYGLEFVDGRYYLPPDDGKERGELATLTNVEKWLRNGVNCANRPMHRSNIKVLLELMQSGDYKPDSSQLFVVADRVSTVEKNGKQKRIVRSTQANLQHNVATIVLATNGHRVSSTGKIELPTGDSIQALAVPEWETVPPYFVAIFVDNFPDEWVDLLDNVQRRTTGDAIARTGIPSAKSNTIASAVRFLRGRYVDGCNVANCRSRLSITQALRSIDNDERFGNLMEILSAVEARNGRPSANDKGEATIDPKSKGYFTLKRSTDPKSPKSTAWGIGMQYLVYCGQILLNGKQFDTADDFAIWLQRIAFSPVDDLSHCELQLRDFLIHHGEVTTSAKRNWNAIVKAILLVAGYRNRKFGKSPDFDLERELLYRERGLEAKGETRKENHIVFGHLDFISDADRENTTGWRLAIPDSFKVLKSVRVLKKAKVETPEPTEATDDDDDDEVEPKQPSTKPAKSPTKPRFVQPVETDDDDDDEVEPTDDDLTDDDDDGEEIPAGFDDDDDDE